MTINGCEGGDLDSVTTGLQVNVINVATTASLKFIGGEFKNFVL